MPMPHIEPHNRPGEARKAVILARVSDREQEDGYSIDAQRHLLEVYCAQRDLEVVRSFEIVESSTVGDRGKFMEMMAFVKRQKEIIAVVADKVDRVMRSFKEYPLLDEMIRAGKIELHFRSENYLIHRDSRSHEHMMWNFSIMMAKAYTDNIRDNVNRAKDHKIRLGEYPSLAPIGYLNVKKSEAGRSDIILDPERAPLVLRLFLEYSTGAYTIPELTEKTQAWGLRNRSGKKGWLYPAHVHRILHDPFYYGIMTVKGEQYPHRYEPLIDKILFDKCQDITRGWHRKPYKCGENNHVFRGLVTDAITGKVVSCDIQRKKYKNGSTAEWTYLRCANPYNPDKKLWVKESTVMAQVEDVFKRMEIPEAIFERLISYVKQASKTEQDFIKRQTEEAQREYKGIQDRMSKLMDLLIDGTVEREEFEHKKAQLRTRQREIEAQMQANREGDDGFQDTMLGLLGIARRAHSLFIGSTTEQKRQYINLVFSNLQLKGETLCYSLQKPFDRFVECHKFEEWRARQDSNLRPTASETGTLSS